MTLLHDQWTKVYTTDRSCVSALVVSRDYTLLEVVRLLVDDLSPSSNPSRARYSSNSL